LHHCTLSLYFFYMRAMCLLYTRIMYPSVDARLHIMFMFTLLVYMRTIGMPSLLAISSRVPLDREMWFLEYSLPR